VRPVFAASTDWPVSRPSTSELDGSLSPDTAESLSLCIAVILSALVWCEHEVAIDDHTDREAGPDGTPADRGSIIVRRAGGRGLAGRCSNALASTPKAFASFATISIVALYSERSSALT